MKGPKTLLDLDDLSNYRDSNYMSSTALWYFETLPSRHLLVLKTFPRRLQTFSTQLQRNNFTSSKTSSRKNVTLKTTWRRLEDMFWRRLEVVLTTCLRDVLKTYLEDVLKTLWREGKYWGYLYLANLNVYLTNLYFTNLYLTILRRIQNALIRTQ